MKLARYRVQNIVLLLFSIAAWQLSQAQTVKTLWVNPDYARGGTATQLFDSVTYIPLETTKESVFGDIQKLQVSDHYFDFADF